MTLNPSIDFSTERAASRGEARRYRTSTARKVDCIPGLGSGKNPRLRFALDLLRTKRRADGRWNRDPAQTDSDDKGSQWSADHPEERPVPLSFESARKPGKMITLRALRVPSRVS